LKGKDMSKMIKIGNREFSEDTIKEALKKHCDFEEKTELKLRHGDILENNKGVRRVIFQKPNCNGYSTFANACEWTPNDSNSLIEITKWLKMNKYKVVDNVFDLEL
jgi:hypothetical protein